MQGDTSMYLIWSFEHDAWWGPSQRGYVQDFGDAGRYRFEVAKPIVERANIARFNEALIPLPDVIGAARPPGRPTEDDERAPMIAGKISDDDLAKINDGGGFGVHPGDVGRIAAELLALRARYRMRQS